jgi:1-phosphofructokinase family hexose kinase
MILCITPNPALDRTIILPSLVLGNVHRAQKIMVAAGGKGLNVARTIRNLGGEPLCMGFTGGHSGHLLGDLTKNEGLSSSWTWTQAETRTCTILVSQNGDATVINEPGMAVSASDWQRLQLDLHQQIPSTRLICLSGSLPPDSSTNAVHGLFEILVGSGKQAWVDTSGVALRAALAHPGMNVKVNGNEIGEILGFDVNDMDSAKHALILLGKRMRSTCVITLGSLGAIMATSEGRWLAQAPSVPIVSTVGSGDAFLGGLATALDGGKNWPDSLCDAIAAGTANSLSAGAGRFALHEFQEIRKQVQIQAW